MTKTQIAKWIVEQGDKETATYCFLCSKMDTECDYKCVEGIAEALRQAEKERYGRNE